jgi:colanic acid biosynthesis glycosyl transferase WcaI
MRILVWGINYHPEQVGIAPYNRALCEYLAREGHDVEVVTTFPYYPMWKKSPRDRGRLFRGETIGGVRVNRCWHFVPRSPTGLGRILHEASFVCTSTLRALFAPRADVIVVISPPLLIGAAAWLVGRLKGIPHVLHIQDLQPDAAVGLGMVRRKWFIHILRGIERFNYRKAARVSVISQAMVRALGDRGFQRVEYFPNWVTGNGAHLQPGAFRAEWGIGPDEFLLLYSGNIGVKQGLARIVRAAARVKEIRLVICGDGAARPEIERIVASGAAPNVTLIPLQPEEKYRLMMADADVCVISQRAGSAAAFFPSKLLSCVAFGKPVLAVADRDSELARVVREEDLGIWVALEDLDAVAKVMRSLPSNVAKLRQCAQNGRHFAARFEEEKVLSTFETLLESLTSPHPQETPLPTPSSIKSQNPAAATNSPDRSYPTPAGAPHPPPSAPPREIPAPAPAP